MEATEKLGRGPVHDSNESGLVKLGISYQRMAPMSVIKVTSTQDLL
jgi:hypothetical protein